MPNLQPIQQLPERPVPFDSIVGRDLIADQIHLPKRPTKQNYVAHLEWAWLPGHGRIDEYHLHKGRKRWSLWVHSPIFSEDDWDWFAVGSVPIEQASLKEASVHLLAEYLISIKNEDGLDRFHMIGIEGILSCHEVHAIGNLVW